MSDFWLGSGPPLNYSDASAAAPVVSEKSITLSWALLEWSVQSDRYGDQALLAHLFSVGTGGAAARTPYEIPSATSSRIFDKHSYFDKLWWS
jgi:hypothetical protein